MPKRLIVACSNCQEPFHGQTECLAIHRAPAPPCCCEIDHPMGGEPQIAYCPKHAAVDDLIAALENIRREVGTSTLAWHICEDALKKAGIS